MPAMIAPTPSHSWNSSSSAFGAAPERDPGDHEQRRGARVGDQQLGVLAQPVELGARLRLLGERPRQLEEVGEHEQHPERAEAAGGGHDHRAPAVAQDPLGRERGRREQRRAEHAGPGRAPGRQIARRLDQDRRQHGEDQVLDRQHDDARERQQVEQPAGAAEAADQQRGHEQQHQRRRRLLRHVQRAVLVGRLERLDDVEQQRQRQAQGDRERHDRTRPCGDRPRLLAALGRRLCWCADVGPDGHPGASLNRMLVSRKRLACL